MEFCTKTIWSCAFFSLEDFLFLFVCLWFWEDFGFVLFCFCWEISMSAFISLGVMGLFRWSIWSWFNFGIWYLSRKLSISSRFSSCVEYRLLWEDLMTFFTSLFSVVKSAFSFLILIIWILSLCPLVSLARGLYNLVDFSKSSSWFYWFFV